MKKDLEKLKEVVVVVGVGYGREKEEDGGCYGGWWWW